MPAYRFYLEASLEVGQTYPLPQEEAHHLIRVMRRQPGDILEVINGQGRLAQGRLTSQKTVLIISIEDYPAAPILILAQALPKLNRLDIIIEKGTELGMTHLILFPGEKSEKTDLSPTQYARIKHLSIAALKQCGRLDLPTCELFPPLRKWKGLDYPTFFGSLEPNAPWLTPQPKGAMIVIGPESGLTNQEEKHLKHLGAQGVKLHSNILRTETAAMVGLTLMGAHR